MATKLDQLRALSTIVADTGDLGAVKAIKPVDCTTNPTLILKAAQMDRYRPFIDEAVTWAKSTGAAGEALVDEVVDRLAVVFGLELAKLVPGRVSTEVNADLSFDTEATIAKARRLIALYKEKGVEKDRILIKIASTWEGICAAEQLEREGINCNLTLLFSMAQAVACAEAGVFLISPFVGRILDWYVKAEGRTFAPHEDPGVLSVQRIYAYYKKFDYKTVVMAASFRNIGEIEELAGCDRLTISPQLLDELNKAEGPLPRKLVTEAAKQQDIARIAMGEKNFRWMMNQDAMATEKLAEGIRGFASDLEKLKLMVLGIVG